MLLPARRRFWDSLYPIQRYASRQKQKPDPHRRIGLLFLYGTPGGIRTPDTWFRRPVLYSTELRARVGSIVAQAGHILQKLSIHSGWKEPAVTIAAAAFVDFDAVVACENLGQLRVQRGDVAHAGEVVRVARLPGHEILVEGFFQNVQGRVALEDAVEVRASRPGVGEEEYPLFRYGKLYHTGPSIVAIR